VSVTTIFAQHFFAFALLIWGYNFGYVCLVWVRFEISRVLLSRALQPEDYYYFSSICQSGRSEFSEWFWNALYGFVL